MNNNKQQFLFIPRDAGFLSVFNFYIGAIHNNKDKKIYPYLNKKALLQYNNISQVKHYSYFDNVNNNIWFRFFEPIKFSNYDNFHIDTNNDNFDIEITQNNKFSDFNFNNLNFHLTLAAGDHNIEAGVEFRFPDETRKLFLDNVIVNDLNKLNINNHDECLYKLKYNKNNWFKEGMFENKYSTVKPFDWKSYINRYSDLVNNLYSEKNAKEHFLRYGFNEGRTGSSDDDFNFKFNKWRREVNFTFKKYIFLKKEIQNKVDNVFNNINNKIISVHCRHPSAFCESGLVLLKDYYKEIDKIFKEFPDSKIFLATDSDFIISSFEFNYGKEKIIYNKDILRTDIDNIIEWAFSLNKKNMDNIGFIDGKGYQIQHISSASKIPIDLGLDIILDIFCLARGNYFIGAQSNITLAVSYINPDLEFKFIKPRTV